MTTVTVELPEALAEKAAAAGLLESGTLAPILEEALRRKEAAEMFEYADAFSRSGVTPLTEEEVMAEVKAARAERRMAKQ